MDGEVIELSSGHALIDLRGGGFDSAVFVGGKPVVMIWSDCEGSVGQFLARAGAVNYESDLKSLRWILDGHLRGDLSLSVQIHPFMELLTPGCYQLELHRDVPDCTLMDYEASWRPEHDHIAFYPYETTLVFLQPTDSLNEERIQHFVTVIQRGQRPIAIVGSVAAGWCDFVIDGHHKLRAYQLAGVAPTFIRICRLNASRLPIETLVNAVGELHPLGPHYERVKAKYDARSRHS